jgi:hypothetical protein|tara:strand:- start:1294 stop:1458 length:165 start_codon:yes stop_codon:yes gene_type:complete
MHDELYNQYMIVIKENGILRQNVMEMQEQINKFQIRIKELIKELEDFQLKYGKN